jgi:hypothetical protein
LSSQFESNIVRPKKSKWSPHDYWNWQALPE